jgi:hypothetical protein
MSVFLHREFQQEGDSPIELWFGLIARNVSDLSERCYVQIPDFPTEDQIGPCFWQSRDDTSFPARGDRCLVVQDNRGQFWVIAWWPFNT